MNKRFSFKNYNEDFKCIHCHNHVSTDSTLSGVINRNHCPYCLYSRHLDLHEAGDRLAACKSKMKPVALTFKKTRNKYGSQQGELMLIHQCTDCGKIAINRIAADDDIDHVLAVYESSLRLDQQARFFIQKSGVEALDQTAEAVIRARLFGWGGQRQADPVYASQY